MLYNAGHPDTDSGSSSLNPSREDVSIALGQPVNPPSFDSRFPHDAYPTPPSSSSSSPTTPESSIPSSHSSNSTPSLPGYSDSLPVPDYRPDPTGGEQRLEFVPRSSIHGGNPGVWTKRIKDMTISLHNQDPIDVQRAPRYGRRGIIRGTIEFDEENLVAFEKVKLVLEGETSVGNSVYEARSETFVRKSFTIWRKLENSAICPQVINFQIPFAAIESRRVGTESLPPSYVCDLGPGGKISCSYSMHITVTQKSKHAFWTSRNRHVIPINYVPRSRPPNAFPTDLDFPLSIKAFPEGWKQIITTQGAISCNLFIPSAFTFCVTDEIPFFIQLVAPSGYIDTRDCEEPKLKVSLQRQVGVAIQNVFTWKDTTSSQGVLKPLPSGSISRSGLDIPIHEAVASSSSAGDSILTRSFKRNRSVKSMRGERAEKKTTTRTRTWEWKGTVCNIGVKVGGCSSEVLVINDFLVLSVSFKKPNGHVLEYQHGQPIEMVSEI